MKPKILIGSAIAVALMGAGILVGSVAGSGSASAQTPSATAQASSTPRAADPLLPSRGGGKGGHGGGGFDRGFGGDFERGLGGNATADGAARSITNATDLIALVKADLTYATGKMDTADVQRWVSGADALLKSAQSANTGSQFGQAVSYARAARELAMTAESRMAQELGANTLPSYSQLLQGRDHAPSTTATITQAQASRILAETYNRLTAQATQVTAASNAAEARPYLTDAQAAYKAAYDAYQAGNYTNALSSSRLAERLAGVAGSIARASTAPANADTPVTVPAPNF